MIKYMKPSYLKSEVANTQIPSRSDKAMLSDHLSPYMKVTHNSPYMEPNVVPRSLTSPMLTEAPKPLPSSTKINEIVTAAQ